MGIVMKARGSKRASLEDQPTRELKLEEQATLPMAIGQRSTERAEIAQQNPEHRPPQSRGNQQHRRSYKTLLCWAPLVIFALLLVSVMIGRSAIESWFSHNFARNESPTPEVQVYNHLPNPTQTTLIDTTANSFMHAMMHKDWPTM